MTPSSTRDELCKKIKCKIIEPPDDDSSTDAMNDFIPEITLRNLVSPVTVENVLQNSGLQLQTPIPDLALWFSKDAFKLFAILIYKGRLELIEHLYKHRIRNDMLPIRMNNKSYKCQPSKPSHQKTDAADKPPELIEDEAKVHEAFSAQSPWPEDPEQGIYLFCSRWQWPFTSPVFVAEQFEYYFDSKIHLPFTKLGPKISSPNAVYSSVRVASVHSDHLPKIEGIAVDDEGNPRVAIKRLMEMGDNFERIAEGEADVLKTMKERLNHKHLIKAIAYYCTDNKGTDDKVHCFMFPWAEKGNLWEFWKKDNTKDRTEKEYIIWVFTQLIGLTDAIRLLHHGDSTLQLDSNCRHGDLKPENILCFNESGSQNPRLVVTDVGLARSYNEGTEYREVTAHSVSTARYAPPELEYDPKTPHSRRFDVWSLGCIFLEFVIWLLYDFEKLNEFRDAVNPFYKANPTPPEHLGTSSKPTVGKIALLHDELERWILYMKTEDWRCSEGTALRRLIDLIHTRMLNTTLLLQEHVNKDALLSVPTKTEQTEQTSDPNATKEIAKANLLLNTPSLVVPLEGPADPRIKFLKPGARRGTSLRSDELIDDPRIRAYAPQVAEKLKTILSLLQEELGKEGEAIKAVGERPLDAAPGLPAGPSIRFTKKEKGNPASTEKLNEYVSKSWPILRMIWRWRKKTNNPSSNRG